MIEPTHHSNTRQPKYDPLPYWYDDGSELPNLDFKVLEAWAIRQRDNEQARHACDELILLWSRFAVVPRDARTAQRFADNRYTLMRTIRLLDVLDDSGKSPYRIINRWERQYGTFGSKWRARLLWWSPFYGKGTRYIKPSIE